MKTKTQHLPSSLGRWHSNGSLPSIDENHLKEAIYKINNPVVVVEKDGAVALGQGGKFCLGEMKDETEGFSIIGYVPRCPVSDLGDPSFCKDYGIKYPYLSGSMANGIGSVEIAEAMGKGGMLGFFGAAGLPIPRVKKAIDYLESFKDKFPYGFNLIHSPNEQDLEAAVVDLYIENNINLVEASAFLGLTPSVVRYRIHGIHRDSAGKIITPNRVIAKISRVEVASKFFSPPPDKILDELVRAGNITHDQAKLASEIPMAQDITVEADSGGHTDNQQALALFPTIVALRDEFQKKFNYSSPIRVGAGGGIASPASAAAVFSMGAAYIVVGTVNQCTLEAGTSDCVREMLSQAQQADITLAPAADMIEMGVKVQVLKRGTMFAMRAAKLYDTYRNYESLSAIPADLRKTLENSYLKNGIDDVWNDTKAFFRERDPQQIVRAEKDPKHQMALVFRWYLGQSSKWANAGEASRKIDYQIWCGPAMGAFNEWVKGTFLEDYKKRNVVTIAMNILFGTAVQLRLNSLRFQGISLSSELMNPSPLTERRIKELIK